MEFNQEKEGRRQEEMAEHKLNKNQFSVAYYNPKQDGAWIVLSACLCEVWGFFNLFFKTLQHNMPSQTNSYFTQWVILNKNVD